jgi:hypothetical protein
MDDIIEDVLSDQRMTHEYAERFYHERVARFHAEFPYEMEIKLLLELFLTSQFDPIARHYMLIGLRNALHNAKLKPLCESTRCVIAAVLRGASSCLLNHRQFRLEASVCQMLIGAMHVLYTCTHDVLPSNVINILNDIPHNPTLPQMIAAISTALRACHD